MSSNIDTLPNNKLNSDELLIEIRNKLGHIIGQQDSTQKAICHLSRPTNYN